MYSISNGPSVKGLPAADDGDRNTGGAIGSPARLASSRPAAKGVMKTGTWSRGQKSSSAP